MFKDASPEQRRSRIEALVKSLLLLVVGFIVAPFIFLAIKGLIGLAVAAVVGVVLIQFAPVVAVSIANWRLKMLKAEAARNPIETLQNDYRSRMDALKKFREAITMFSAEVKNFDDKLDGFKQQYPDQANRFDQQLKMWERLLEVRTNKYRRATSSLEAYEQEIAKTEAIWEMGQAATRMSKAAGMTDDDFLAKIMTDTAIGSVQRNMNSAFADLEISLLDEDRDRAQQLYAAKYEGGSVPAPAVQSKALPASPRTVPVEIDLKPLDVAELVRAGGHV